MPRPRFMRLDAGRRDEWLEAAAAEFAVRGYDQASLNAILGRLGLSKGQFYYYFDDKADLFGGVFEWTFERVLPPDLNSRLKQLSAEQFWPYFEELTEQGRELLRAMPWYMGLMRHLYHPPSEESARRVVEEKMAMSRELQVTFVRRGQELGCIRRDLPDELLLVLISAFVSARDHWFLDHWEALSKEERDMLPGRLVALFRRAFEPPLAPSSERSQ